MDRRKRGLAPYSPSSLAREPAGRGSVFTYGTLLEASFVANLLGHPVASAPARLTGFGVAQLGGGAAWPVLLREEGGEVVGRLYRWLGREDLRRLDAYEGVGEGLYRREMVTVQVEGGTEERAFVYLPTARTLQRYGVG